LTTQGDFIFTMVIKKIVLFFLCIASCFFNSSCSKIDFVFYEAARVDFVVGLDHALIIKKYGEPMIKKSLNDQAIWLYIPTSDLVRKKGGHAQGFEIRFDANMKSLEMHPIDMYAQ